MTLTLTQATTNVRTDLNDLDPTAYRWTDPVIQREIDRALARYSDVAPLLAAVQIPTVAGSRLYPSPSASWWTDRVEYPLGQIPRRFVPFRERISPLILDPSTANYPANSSLTAAAGLTGGSLSAGLYGYAYTFTTPGGETKPFPTNTTTNAQAGGKVTLSSIPTGPSGVTGRTLYRTTAGGSSLLFLTAIPDNATTSYVDTAADGSLGAAAPTTNSTAGVKILDLDLLTLPPDNTGLIEITYATKHTLDSSGTTVPEAHHDALYLGAQAFLVQQYIASINDNFEWVDGQFRDKVDDTKSVTFWHQYHSNLQQNWDTRIRQIEHETNPSVAVATRWGDKPYRWDRL